MTQKRFWNWEDDDYTLSLNHRDLLSMPPGLYAGFDAVLGASLTLQLVHSTTGIQITNLGKSLSNKWGMWRSKMGVFVHEDANINLAISAGDSTFPRIDLIVAEHEYSQVTGGASATYSVIEGTPAASPSAPSLTDANIQTIIGRIYIPANTTTLDEAGVIYTKERIPNYGNDSSIAHLDIEQLWTELQKFQIVTNELEVATISANKIVLSTASNEYLINYVDDDYAEVQDLNIGFNNDEPVQDGWNIKITTLQRLKITFGITDQRFYYQDGDSDIYLEPGETLEITDLSSSISGWTSGETGVFHIQKTGLVHTNTRSNLENLMILAQSTSSVSISSNKADISSVNGNLINLTANTGTGTNNLKYIASLHRQYLTEDISEEVGAHITFKTSGSFDIRLWHDQGSVPTGFKPIYLATGQESVVIQSGSMITLIEEADHWRVIYVSAENIDILNAKMKTTSLVVEPYDCTHLGDRTFKYTLPENVSSIILNVPTYNPVPGDSAAAGLDGFLISNITPFEGIHDGYELLIKFNDACGMTFVTKGSTSSNIYYIENHAAPPFHSTENFFAQLNSNNGLANYYGQGLYVKLVWSSEDGKWIETHRDSRISTY